jgi:hypothetical protein
MGACLGKNNNITVNDIQKGINNKDNNKNEKTPKFNRKKFIATISLDKMCIQFQEINKFKNNLPILYSENNPNILDITEVINEGSNNSNNEDNRNNTTFEEILELFN